MEAAIQYHEAAAALTARVFLGFLFFFQGYDAVFRVGIRNTAAALEIPFARKGIPAMLTLWGAWFTSLAALAGGALLITGFLKYYALYLLGLDLLLAAMAFGITRPMWDMQFAFPRLALLLFLLATPPGWDAWSLDQLFVKP